MTDGQELVIIGKLGSPHGVKGWIKLNSYAEPAENILNYQPWQLQSKTGWRPITYAEVAHHATGIVVRLAECTDRNAAQLLTNTVVAVYRSQMPKLHAGEYYWSDLQGLTVINLEELVLGKIDYLHETGANDVLVVTGEKQYLIPYLPGSIVQNVDLAAGKILVDWNADF